MKMLDTMTAKGAWLATLAVGTALKVAFCNISGQQDADDPVYDAEVIAQNPEEHQADVLVSVEGVPGGCVTTLYYSDGESLNAGDPRLGTGVGSGVVFDSGYFAIADEQPDHEDAVTAAHDEPEEITGTIEEPGSDPIYRGPGTLLTLGSLPKGPSWLLEQANVLDAEANKYRDYTPPHQSLKGAAAALRSAVGHVLAGGCEKVPTDKPEPF